MYSRILAAVNEHLTSEIMARYAIEFARASNCKLYLCYIAEKDAPPDAVENGNGALKRLQAISESEGVNWDTITGSGDPVEKIKELVQQESIDLAFASARHKDMENRYFSRTTANRLSLELPCSFALVRVVHMARIRPHEILVPVKARISHLAERAFFCAMMARAFDSRIFLFHAEKPMKSFFSGEIRPRSVELEESITGDLDQFIKILDSYQVKHERKLFHGAAGPGITIEAASKRSDLIIMGANRRSFLSSLFRRENPVEEVMRNTPCNLIILSPRQKVKKTK